MWVDAGMLASVGPLGELDLGVVQWYGQVLERYWPCMTQALGEWMPYVYTAVLDIGVTSQAYKL